MVMKYRGGGIYTGRMERLIDIHYNSFISFLKYKTINLVFLLLL